MKETVLIRALMSVIALMCATVANATAPVGRMKVEFRVVANEPAGIWLMRALNETDRPVTFAGPYQPDLLVYRLLHEPPDGQGWRRQRPPASSRRGNITIPAGELLYHRFYRPELMLYSPDLANAYSAWQWRYMIVEPTSDMELVDPLAVHIGYVREGVGELPFPHVDTDSVTVSNLLAFVFHQHMRGGIPIEDAPPHELAFLLLNGTDASREISPPLIAESILHISAPAIGYSAEITLPDSGFEAQVIPPGESGQWRIPFERILAQMPAETVEAIRTADGALDVVWKSGDRESPPLPLILLPPTQAELDAAFLAEHADVPRIDEHTDLSLDLRLAGIESEPAFLGRLKNNEPHTVLWENFVYDYCFIDVSYLRGSMFSLRPHGQGRRPFLIDSNQEVFMRLSFSRFVAVQLDRNERTRADAEAGFVLGARWQFLDKIVNTLWIAFPGDNDQLSVIHAYDVSWHSQTSFEVSRDGKDGTITGVPDLPPIAPLLAYVHNSETPPELTCVLWNRTDDAIQVADSRIIVSAPSADYRRKLTLPDGLNLPATVAPGEHTDWRIPWASIIDRIPPNDLARIKSAGGELDLVWHVNGLDSPPLPLLLGWDGQAE